MCDRGSILRLVVRNGEVPVQTITVVNHKPILINSDGTWRLLTAQGSALEKMRAAAQLPEVLELFRGLFETIGLEIVDTGETVTCHHRGDRIEFEPGLTTADYDGILKIYDYQLDSVLENAKTGYNDTMARFKLVREFLTALPESGKTLLNNSFVTNPAFRKLIHSKDLMHLHLVSPDHAQEPDATYTLFFVNGCWNVARGLSGAPDRVFRLLPEDALELLRRGISAKHAGVIDMAKLAKWYVDWRERVEVKAA
jgi:hypothetical protein